MPSEFDRVIGQKNINYVLFGIRNCKPCEILKQSIYIVRENFPNIGFWYVPSRSINYEAAQLEKKYRVKYVPRSILFRGGVEIGRFLSHVSPETLSEYLNEAALMGVLSPKPGDVEAILITP